MTSETFMIGEGILPEVKTPFRMLPELHISLEKLKSQIRNHEKSAISSKVLSDINIELGNPLKENVLEVSGLRLSKKICSSQALVLSHKLHSEPNDSDARLELLGLFLELADQTDLVAARDAYLLSLLELESPYLNSTKINTAISTQSIYLKKLVLKLEEDLQISEQKKNELTNDNQGFSKEIFKIKGGVSYMKELLSILDAPRVQCQFKLDLRPGNLGKKLPTIDLVNGYDPFLRTLCYIPPADTSRNRILEILKLLESRNPLIGYHESKIHEIKGRIRFAEALIIKEEEKIKQAEHQISKAINCISQAVDLVGYTPEKSVEIATLTRFGQICYLTARTYRLHQIPLPHEHKERLKKAVLLLKKIPGDANASKVRLQIDQFLKGL